MYLHVLFSLGGEIETATAQSAFFKPMQLRFLSRTVVMLALTQVQLAEC